MSVIQCPVQSRVQLGDPTKSTAKFASFTQVNWQGSTHFCGPTSELENFYVLSVNLPLNFVCFMEVALFRHGLYTVLGVTRYLCNALRNIITFVVTK